MIKIEVKEGKLPWFIGGGTIAAGIIIGILLVVYAKNPVYIKSSFPVVLTIILAGAVMCLCAANRGLVVQDESLCYKNCFGRKKNFTLGGVGYCRVALESGSSRDYLILCDGAGAKLCKLEFNMKNTDIFLRYLIDNGIETECSKKSDMYLKWMVNTRLIASDEAKTAVKDAYDKAYGLIEGWVKRNEGFGAGWKFGLAFYMEDNFVQGKQLCEQEGAADGLIDRLLENAGAGLLGEFEEDKDIKLPEGLFIVMEGYLQKESKFVIDRKGRAVSVSVKLMQVSKPMKVSESVQKSKPMQESGLMSREEPLGLYFFGGAVEHLSQQLLYYEQILPKRRYHLGELEFKHELYLEK